MRLVFQPKKFQIEFKTQFKNLSPRIKVISKNNFGVNRSEVEVFWGEPNNIRLFYSFVNVVT